MQDNNGTDWLVKQLEDRGAVITNSHLQLTSGDRHSDSYLNLRVLAGHNDILYLIGKALAEAIGKHETELVEILSLEELEKDVVIVGPETLGRTFAEYIAIIGGVGHFAWCDMSKDSRGNNIATWNPKLEMEKLIKDARCYCVDDLNTSGGSLLAVKKLIEESGGKFEGAITVVRRDQTVTAETLGIPWLYQLMDVIGFNTYDAASCPLCAKRVPMRLRPGHGHEFIKNNPDYPVEEV